jgi:hypothetical protein
MKFGQPRDDAARARTSRSPPRSELGKRAWVSVPECDTGESTYPSPIFVCLAYRPPRFVRTTWFGTRRTTKSAYYWRPESPAPRRHTQTPNMGRLTTQRYHECQDGNGLITPHTCYHPSWLNIKWFCLARLLSTRPIPKSYDDLNSQSLPLSLLPIN